MPKAIAYGRLSHRSSMGNINQETGDAIGLEAQEDSCRRYWKCYLEQEGVSWLCFVPDKAVSAYTKPFDSRPGGKLILELLEPGDHLIFDKLDRMWRSMEDFIFLSKILENRGVTWHIANMHGTSVRRGTFMGDFLIQLFVSLAQMEAGRTSERIVNERAFLRSQGRYDGRKPQVGMKAIRKLVKTSNGERRKIVDIVWDEEMRAAMGLIVRMYDEEGLGYRKIWGQLNQRLTSDLGLPPFSRDRLKLNSIGTLQTIYIREKQYQILGNPDPKTIYIKDQFTSEWSLELKEKVA